MFKKFNLCYNECNYEDKLTLLGGGVYLFNNFK